MKKQIMIGAASLATIGVVGAASLGLASAQTSTTPHDTLVDKIAQKFNLNKADVQKVFDENREAHEAERQQKQSDRIDQAVKDGKISQSLADQLKAKLKELDAFRDSLKDKTPEERRTAMKAKMDEFKQWLTDNKVPAGIAGPAHGHHGRGMGPMMDHDGAGDQPPAPNTTN